MIKHGLSAMAFYEIYCRNNEQYDNGIGNTNKDIKISISKQKNNKLRLNWLIKIFGISRC